MIWLIVEEIVGFKLPSHYLHWKSWCPDLQNFWETYFFGVKKGWGEDFFNRLFFNIFLTSPLNDPEAHERTPTTQRRATKRQFEGMYNDRPTQQLQHHEPPSQHQHRGDKPYQCMYCEKCFGEKRSLTDHIRTHTGEKPFQCEVCDRSFSIKSNLVTHMRTHTGDKPYKCEICGRAFSHRVSVRKHMKTHGK